VQAISDDDPTLLLIGEAVAPRAMVSPQGAIGARMKPLPPMSIDQARDLILRSMPRPGGVETVPLALALGRVAVEDVIAPGDQPRFDCAAMDGWVVCGQAGAYRVVGESRAGAPYGAIMAQGEAVAISTGAIVPEGASALVRREQGYEDQGQLTIAAYRPGFDMRPRGCDFRRGDVLVAAERVLDHLDIARVAASGIERIAVRPVLRVALLATGTRSWQAGASRGRAGLMMRFRPRSWRGSAAFSRWAWRAMPMAILRGVSRPAMRRW
jgi:molybdopterin molybdotransferase